FYFNPALFLPWVDADNAYARGKHFLKVHEHQRPVEAARIDETVDESGAVMQPGILVEGEKPLQGCALLFKLGDLLKYFFRFGTHFGISFAGQIDVPAEAEEDEGRDNAHDG